MYQLLPAAWRNAALTIYAALAIYAAGFLETIGLSISAYRTGAALAFLVMSLLLVTFGFSAYSSPWRWLWRKFPSLNKLIFPDLNGVWVGITSSNWPVIAALRDAAEREGAINLESLGTIPLQENGIAMLVEAHLFSIKITTRTANTRGNSHAITVNIDKFFTKNDIRLLYIYEQETPAPDHTDESTHIGAGDIRFTNNNFEKCEGIYWTRRSWRQGSNTAGQIHLARVTSHFDPKEHDLLNMALGA